MDPRALRERALATGALLMLIATGLLVGAFFLGSFYLQLVRGYSALSTGLTFLPVAVAAVVGAHTASRLVGRVDRRGLTAPALTLAAVGAAVAARWHGPVPLITGMTVAALGIGATLVAATTTALANVDPGQAGLTSGLVSTFHEFGSALGVAVLSTLAAPSIAAVTGSALSGTAVSGAAGGPGLSGFTRAFTASAIAALAAALLAVLVAPPGKADPGAVPVAH
jgi:MFS family permease